MIFENQHAFTSIAINICNHNYLQIIYQIRLAQVTLNTAHVNTRIQVIDLKVSKLVRRKIYNIRN